MGSTDGNDEPPRCIFEPKIFQTIAMFCMVLGCLTLTIFASDYIPPYVYAKDFKQTTCTVESGYIATNACCVSDVTTIGNCPNSYIYPCAKVSVLYQVENETINATLYDEHRSAAYVSGVERCSYYHCFYQSYSDHLADAEQFVSDQGTPGQEYTCYYNPNNKQEAIHDIVSLSKLLHSILWPFTLIMLSTAIFIVLEMYMKKRPQALSDDEVYVNDDEKALTANIDAISHYSMEHSVNISNGKKQIYMSNGTRNGSVANMSRPNTAGGNNADMEKIRAKSAKRNSKTSKGSNDMKITPVH